MGFERDRLPDPSTYFESQGLVLQPGAKWRTGPCHAHGSSDSLRVNMHTGAFVCMAGCGLKGGDIVAYQMQSTGQDFVTACKSLGAWIHDPMDKSLPRTKPLPFPARDALEVLTAEANLAAVAAANVAHGVTLTPEDRSRLLRCAARIRVILEEVSQ